MKLLLKIRNFLTLMIISFSHLSAFSIVHAERTKNYLLPNSIQTIIGDSLPKYTIPNEKQFDDDWKSSGEIKTPMFAISDFNGDSKKDYAAILLSKDCKHVLFVVFVSNKKNESFSIHKIRTFKLESNLIDIYINVDMKGYWESVSGKQYIKNDGIGLTWGSASLEYGYYWEKNGFQIFYAD